MIPKIIHQIWVGPNPLPKRERGFVEKVKIYNPYYTHYLWTDAIVHREDFPEEFRIQYDQFYAQGQYAFCADILRIWVVYTFGGFYLDVDFEPLKSLDDFLDNSGFLLYHPNTNPPDYTIVNGAFGFQQGAVELQYCLDRITQDGYWYGPEWFGRTIKHSLIINYEFNHDSVKFVLNQFGVNYFDWEEFHAKYYRHYALYSWSDVYTPETL